jgi:hypothetical protein
VFETNCFVRDTETKHALPKLQIRRCTYAADDEGGAMRARFEWIWRYLNKLGPYVLVEVLLPGGTVLALLLWLSQYRRKTARLETEGT